MGITLVIIESGSCEGHLLPRRAPSMKPGGKRQTSDSPGPAPTDSHNQLTHPHAPWGKESPLVNESLLPGLRLGEGSLCGCGMGLLGLTLTQLPFALQILLPGFCEVEALGFSSYTLLSFQVCP